MENMVREINQGKNLVGAFPKEKKEEFKTTPMKKKKKDYNKLNITNSEVKIEDTMIDKDVEQPPSHCNIHKLVCG